MFYFIHARAMLPISVILTHVRAPKPPSDELGHNVSIRRLTFRNVCWGRKFLLHLFPSRFWLRRFPPMRINIEIARSKEEKTHGDPEPAGEYWAGGEAGTTSAVPMRASRVLTSRGRLGCFRHSVKLRGLMGDSQSGTCHVLPQRCSSPQCSIFTLLKQFPYCA